MWGSGCSYLCFNRRDIGGWRGTGQPHADAGVTQPNSFCHGACYAGPRVPKRNEHSEYPAYLYLDSEPHAFSHDIAYRTPRPRPHDSTKQDTRTSSYGGSDVATGAHSNFRTRCR